MFALQEVSVVLCLSHDQIRAVRAKIWVKDFLYRILNSCIDLDDNHMHSHAICNYLKAETFIL